MVLGTTDDRADMLVLQRKIDKSQQGTPVVMSCCNEWNTSKINGYRI